MWWTLGSIAVALLAVLAVPAAVAGPNFDDPLAPFDNLLDEADEASRGPAATLETLAPVPDPLPGEEPVRCQEMKGMNGGVGYSETLCTDEVTDALPDGSPGPATEPALAARPEPAVPARPPGSGSTEDPAPEAAAAPADETADAFAPASPAGLPPPEPVLVPDPAGDGRAGPAADPGPGRGGHRHAAMAMAAVTAGLAMALLVKSLAAALFTRLDGPRLLQHPQRARILEAVGSAPGIHYLGLARATGIPRGTLDHHLYKLQRAGFVHRRESGGLACYFPKPPEAGTLAAALATRSEAARSLLEAIRDQPGTTAQALAAATSCHPSSMSHHLIRLAAAGLVERQRRGRSLHLRLTELGAKAIERFAAPAPATGPGLASPMTAG